MTGAGNVCTMSYLFIMIFCCYPTFSGLFILSRPNQVIFYTYLFLHLSVYLLENVVCWKSSVNNWPRRVFVCVCVCVCVCALACGLRVGQKHAS